MSSVNIKMDLGAFQQEIKATAERMGEATRPAAQKGADIIYRLAKIYAPVFEAEPGKDGAHYFYGQYQRYGPFRPGNLRDSIYQAFSKDNSFSDVSTYHVSWNAEKAPYGGMVEFGTSRAPAKSFIGRAVKESRKEVRAAMKARFIEELSK